MAFAGASEFTAVRAIVIGGDQESGLRIDRFAVEGQVLNTLCLRCWLTTGSENVSLPVAPPPGRYSRIAAGVLSGLPASPGL